MKDIDKVLSGKNGEVLKSLADSEEAKRLSQMFDVKSVEDAVARGDMAELKSVLASVLKTSEGKKLAERLKGL